MPLVVKYLSSESLNTGIFHALITPSCPAVKMSLDTFFETLEAYIDGPVIDVKDPA